MKTLSKHIPACTTRLLVLAIALFAMAPTLLANAPEPPESKEECERHDARRRNLSLAQARLLACELGLPAADSVRLVETFMAYQAEVWAMKPPRMPKPGEKLSDEEARKKMQQKFEHAQRMLDLQRKYYNIYSTFLTPTQIQQVFDMERDMMKRLRPKGGKPGKGGKHGPGPRPHPGDGHEPPHGSGPRHH